MTCFDEFAGRRNFGLKNMKKSYIWKKHACLYDISTKAFSDRVKKISGARKHFSGNERRWLVYHTSQCSTGFYTTDLLRADWLYAARSVALPIVGDS